MQDRHSMVFNKFNNYFSGGINFKGPRKPQWQKADDPLPLHFQTIM